jgi:molybdate transport system substrate-binding protein
MIKITINLSILSLILASCSFINRKSISAREEPENQVYTTQLTIFTAASLVEPFNELGNLFESQNPGIDLVFNFAGSQQLAHQIAQDAPCDIFASADSRQMDAIVQTGRINPQNPLTFTHNQLVVIFPVKNPANIQNLQDLSKPGLKLVLAAAAVPVGNYSQQFLIKAAQSPEYTDSFTQDVLNNVVSYETNVKAVLSKVLLGEADAGIVYTSDVTDNNTNQLGKLPIPKELNILAEYLIATLTDSQQHDLANDFITFLVSPVGQEILSKHGFITVK